MQAFESFECRVRFAVPREAFGTRDFIGNRLVAGCQQMSKFSRRFFDRTEFYGDVDKYIVQFALAADSGFNSTRTHVQVQMSV